MRKSIVLLAAMALVVAWAVPAAAFWEEGMDFKMHYPQLPDATPTGWDVLSSGLCEAPVCRVADDFQCTETGWVKDIHFWGSWKDDMVGVIDHFRLEIYTNDASGPFSQPGQMIWWYDWPFDPAHVIPFQAAGEGWWDPCTPEVIPDNHGLYYQYNIYLPQA
ncbi:MAG: hypothetical protein JW952_04305, partial [Candidatus Eisenbacteria bacterium]|nr:hypothetical protein [Candidatus Eisenbacteria bacterium]